MSVVAVERRGAVGRIAYGALAALLLVGIVLETIKHGTGYWQIGVFGLGPDLTLLFGAAGGLEQGQIHPRAVRLYNLVHRFWGPVILAALASFVLPLGFFIGAFAWAFHIALDRALGYGLRTPGGFHRA